MPRISRDEQLQACKKCRRLSNQLTRLRESHPDYWNRPVPAAGDATSPILVVGLAPGMHGANKTGKPFVGDASGQLLNQALDQLGLQRRVRITNAVKCLPIKNLPSAKEVRNCSFFLAAELEAHLTKPNPVVFALGGLAHKAVIATLGLRQADCTFGHGHVHQHGHLWIVDSYHCSRYNTQTGRLTLPMFLDALGKAQQLARL